MAGAASRPSASGATKPRPFRLRAVEPTEAAILASILKALSYATQVAWAQRMNTGAHVVDGPGGRRFVRYGFPGCADVIGMMRDGRFLALEVKTRTGRLTADQDAFLDLVRRNGGVAGVARSIEDAMAIVGAG